MNPAARGANDEVVNLALIGLLTAFALALVLRGAATVAALLTGTDMPESGIASGLRVIADPDQPARAFGAPGMSAIAYWSVVTGFLGLLTAVAWGFWRLVARLRHRTARDPHRIQGTATARDIDAAASRKALLRRAATLRPSIQHPRANDVGYLIGRSCGREIWASVEDPSSSSVPRAPARVYTSSSTPSSTLPARSSPPPRGQTTSPPPSTRARNAAQSPYSTHSTSPPDCPQSATTESGGHRSAAVSSH